MSTTGPKVFSPRTTPKLGLSRVRSSTERRVMRVELHPGIFTGNDPMPPIVKVMECIVHGRHDWSADPRTLDAAERYFEISRADDGFDVRGVGP